MHLRTKQTCFKLKAGIQHPGGASTTPSLNLCHRTGSSRTWYRFWEPFHCKKVSLQTPRERVLALPEAPSSQLTSPWRTNQCARVCCQHSKWQEEEKTQKRTATNTCLDKWLLGAGGQHSAAAFTRCVANADDATMPGQSSGPISVCVVSKSPLLEPQRSRYQNSSTRYLISVEMHKNASRVGPMQPAETQFCVKIYVQYIYSRHTQIPEKGHKTR